MRWRDGRQLHLTLNVVQHGFHAGARRHRSSNPQEGRTLAPYVDYARRAEAAKFDAIFISDHLTPYLRGLWYMPDPLTVLAACAGSTERIGLIATVSTSFMSPFHVARKFATLDHLSRGRAGWNIVTSGDEAEARNFGIELPAHDERYVQAREYVDVVAKLWDSWDDDAIVLDSQAGLHVDPMKVQAIWHEGDYYRCTGPLNFPRPPQGHPVLVQAGSSPAGREFAAEIADVVYTAQPSLQSAKAYYDDVKSRAAAYGRDESEIKILPSLITMIGSSEREAVERFEELNSLIDVDAMLVFVSRFTGLDLRHEHLDGPLPPLPATQEFQTHAQIIADLTEREQLTVRELLVRFACVGYNVVVGTGEQVADSIEDWLRSGAADGFNLTPAINNPGLEDFITEVVPELQRRGIFRTEYAGTTLRDHYGLRPPARRPGHLPGPRLTREALHN
jgi:FMN-dependent oxidoreductase (nitrilotriacetate monooxygenase family)